MTLDDIDEIDITESKRKEIDILYRGIFDYISIGYPITYCSELKQFTLGSKEIIEKGGAFLGWYVKYHNNNFVDVLYRGFLFHDPIKFS